MSSSVVAKRYALALFQLAKEKGLLDQIESELAIIKETIKSNPEFETLLKSPKFSIEKKQQMVKEIFASVHEYTLNTLLLLVERRRENAIVEVADHFTKLTNDEKGIAQAEVYSVRPLTEEETKALSETFAAKVGKKSLVINNIIDTDLLGGIKLRIENRIFDGSLRGKLDRLQRKLLVE